MRMIALPMYLKIVGNHKNKAMWKFYHLSFIEAKFSPAHCGSVVRVRPMHQRVWV